METVLLSPSHSRAISNHHNFSQFRDQAKISSSNQKICKSSKKFVACCCESSQPTSQNGFCRRDIVLSGLAASVATVFPVQGSGADEELKMAPIVKYCNRYAHFEVAQYRCYQEAHLVNQNIGHNRGVFGGTT